jgi:hypothetical protein
VKFYLILKVVPFSAAQDNKKTTLEEIENYISYCMCLANLYFILVFDGNFYLAPPDNV